MDRDKTKAAIDIFDKYASQYEAQYMSVEKYHDALDLFCTNLSKQNARILELACGPGNMTKYLLSRLPDLQVLATDLSPAMLEIAQKNNPKASVQILDCRAIRDLEESFDAIVCGFGLPYLSKEESIQLIRDMVDMLHDDGMVYISFMEGEYGNSGYKYASDGSGAGLFTYYHEEGYLKDVFLKCGMEMLDVSRVKYSDRSGEVVDLIMVAKNGNKKK